MALHDIPFFALKNRWCRIPHTGFVDENHECRTRNFEGGSQTLPSDFDIPCSTFKIQNFRGRGSFMKHGLRDFVEEKFLRSCKHFALKNRWCRITNVEQGILKEEVKRFLRTSTFLVRHSRFRISAGGSFMKHGLRDFVEEKFLRSCKHFALKNRWCRIPHTGFVDENHECRTRNFEGGSQTLPSDFDIPCSIFKIQNFRGRGSFMKHGLRDFVEEKFLRSCKHFALKNRPAVRTIDSTRRKMTQSQPARSASEEADL